MQLAVLNADGHSLTLVSSVAFLTKSHDCMQFQLDQQDTGKPIVPHNTKQGLYKT